MQYLVWEDHLEKEMATHSSILAWETPWTEELGGLQSMGSQKESDMTQRLNNSKELSTQKTIPSKTVHPKCRWNKDILG